MRFLVLVQSIIVLNGPYLAELRGVVLHVRVDHEGCQSVVVILADLVLNHCEQVESGEDRSGQVNVVVEVEGHVVGSFERVRGCDHTASGLKTGVDTCFRN